MYCRLTEYTQELHMPKAQPKPEAPAAEAAKAPKPPAPVLRKPQLRLLETLSKLTEPISRPDLAMQSGVDAASCTTWIGSNDEKRRLANDERKKCKSLITLGYVKVIHPKSKDDGPVKYVISPAGKSALAKAQKQQAVAV
jgi:hypothetical protein